MLCLILPCANSNQMAYIKGITILAGLWLTLTATTSLMALI